MSSVDIRCLVFCEIVRNCIFVNHIVGSKLTSQDVIFCLQFGLYLRTRFGSRAERAQGFVSWERQTIARAFVPPRNVLPPLLLSAVAGYSTAGREPSTPCKGHGQSLGRIHLILGCGRKDTAGVLSAHFKLLFCGHVSRQMP